MTTAQLRLQPESKYTSLLNFELIIHSENTKSSIKLKIPEICKIIQYYVETAKETSSTLFEHNKNVLEITNPSSENQIVLKGKIAHATDDSGYSLYPYVTSSIKFEFQLDGVDHLYLAVIMPPGAGPYSGFVKAKINGQKYVWERTQGQSGKKEIEYFSKGEGKDIQSVLGFESSSEKKSFDVSLDIPFRIRTVKLPFISLLPVLVGIPLMIIWGLPNSEFTILSKMSSSLAAIPVLFAIWQRNTEGSIDPFDFLNATWLTSVALWISYAIAFQLLGWWITAEISGIILLTPYFGWIIYHIVLLAWFRNNPTYRNKIPKLFYVFIKFRKKMIRLQDKATHKGKFYEPEAVS